MNSNLILAGSIQKVAFISQTLPVERGIRHVQVSARRAVSCSLYGLSVPPVSDSSAEAIGNLRVIVRGQVVCSDRVSVRRLVPAMVGEGNTSVRDRPVTLQCDFTRPVPNDATTYALIADIEGWVGGGGFSAASVSETAHLQQFRVYLHRR